MTTPSEDLDVEGLVERLKSAQRKQRSPHILLMRSDVEKAAAALVSLRSRLTKAEGEREELAAKLNLPEVRDFLAGVTQEAAHQRARWGADHDAGKEPEDWFWLLGWLAGKAVKAARSGDVDKARHHTISSAAALANWHAALTGDSTAMRPGIDAEERGYVES